MQTPLLCEPCVQEEEDAEEEAGTSCFAQVIDRQTYVHTYIHGNGPHALF